MNPMWIPAVLQGVSFLGKLFGWGQEEEEEPPVGGPFRGSQFTPRPPQDTMARFAPQNRAPQSSPSPDILAYLRKYVR